MESVASSLGPQLDRVSEGFMSGSTPRGPSDHGMDGYVFVKKMFRDCTTLEISLMRMHYWDTAGFYEDEDGGLRPIRANLTQVSKKVKMSRGKVNRVITNARIKIAKRLDQWRQKN